jgi:DNA processing protein
MKSNDTVTSLKLQNNNPQFPQRLRGIKTPPKEIFYKGDITLIDNTPNIAVIGTRQISDKAIPLAFNTGRTLAQMGITVVNGLALGCDTYALKGALSACGKCIAVMPCALDQIVPKSNHHLAHTILENGGLLITEYPTGTKLEKYMYIARDRLQSALSDAVIVIEATHGSGTMHTVHSATEQGKSIACFADSGIENFRNIHTIKTTNDLKTFIDNIYIHNYPQYLQMSINDFEL